MKLAILSFVPLWIFMALAGCAAVPPDVTHVTNGTQDVVIVTFKPRPDFITQILDAVVTYGKAAVKYTTELF